MLEAALVIDQANYLLASKGETGHEQTFDVTNVNAHSLRVEGIDPTTFRKQNTMLNLPDGMLFYFTTFSLQKRLTKWQSSS